MVPIPWGGRQGQRDGCRATVIGCRVKDVGQNEPKDQIWFWRKLRRILAIRKVCCHHFRMEDIKTIYFAQKIIHFSGWGPPNPETGGSRFSAPIEIGGVVEKGLTLHGFCFLNRPDINVSFELRIDRTEGTKAVPIERFDWRAIEGGHSNKRDMRRWKGRRTMETHVHAFSMNWSRSESRMKKANLPSARDLYTDLSSFEEARDYIGRRLRIKNIGVVERPPWEYDLFNGL